MLSVSKRLTLVLVGVIVVSGFIKTTTQARMTSSGVSDYIEEFSAETEVGLDGNITNNWFSSLDDNQNQPMPVNPGPSIDYVALDDSQSEETVFETDYYEDESEESHNSVEQENLNTSNLGELTDEQMKSYAQILNMLYQRLNKTKTAN